MKLKNNLIAQKRHFKNHLIAQKRHFKNHFIAQNRQFKNHLIAKKRQFINIMIKTINNIKKTLNTKETDVRGTIKFINLIQRLNHIRISNI